MKKHLLTLALCLAVTSTAALAAPKMCKKEACPVKPSAQVVKNMPMNCPCHDKQSFEQRKKEFQAKMNKERELLYNNLNMTAEQVKKADALHEKNMKEAEPLMKEMHAQKIKLHELKMAKATEDEIAKQKIKVKSLKKEIKKHMKAAHKEFEAILTQEQLAKFKVIKAEKKAQMHEFRKSHPKCPCGKSGMEPPMGPKFGPPMEPQMGPHPCEVK